MSTSLPANPSFQEFFRALDAVQAPLGREPRDPFPWQQRLAEHLVRAGRWFDEIAVPTGTGKTTCLDVAVWWLATQADRQPVERTAPTRIWWVVNRRMLVDSTAEHAEHLATVLSEHRNQPGPLGAVADRLAAIGGGDPLQVVKLRGGAAIGRPSNPAQPAILLSTVPMFGSRLLFRGYGTSSSMQPVDAAMAGTDALVLLDEAHLAPRLVRLLPSLADCDRSETPVITTERRRPVLVSLTATGDAPVDRRLDLDDTDFAVATINRRVRAHKPVRLAEAPTAAKVPETLAEAAIELLGGSAVPTTCVVFTNRPATAVATAAKVVKAAGRLGGATPDVVVLTGRMRDREATKVRDRLLADGTGVRAGESTTIRERSLVVVATQTLEVGADLDFDHLVTEACGRRALVQRLGRLNRLGEKDDASGVYVHTPPTEGGRSAGLWGLYDTEPAEVIDALRSASNAETHTVDLGPERVREVLGAPQDDDPEGPEPLAALLAEWVKTTTRAPGEADVEPYFAGYPDQQATVSVCWRAFLPTPEEENETLPIWPRVTEAECVDVPIADLKSFRDGLPVMVLTPDRTSYATDWPDKVSPGSTVILPIAAGGYSNHGWDPSATDAVLDVSLLDAGIVLDPGVLSAWTGVETKQIAPLLAPLDDVREQDGSLSAAEARQALEDAITSLLRGLRDELAIRPAEADANRIDNDDWGRLIATWESAPKGRAWLRLVETSPRLDRIEWPRRHRVLLDATDDLSIAGELSDAARQLDKHGTEVGRLARSTAIRAGVPEPLADDVALAAELHDIGKADDRFQLWLDPSGESLHSARLAKSARPRAQWAADRTNAGWPKGGRHEALSARLSHRLFEDGALSANDPDLVLHLVGAHHGYGRPLLAGVPDGSETTVSFTVNDATATVTADLAITDVDQPSRFERLNRRYGYWGLVLLEALLRQADHQVSGRRDGQSDSGDEAAKNIEEEIG
jgi:CRISPR-associated endonuclease/helicase Cas3